MATSLESISAMGLFANIPVEIRNQIWFETSFRTKASVIQTCKQLNIDYKDWIYDGIGLVFHLDPRQQSEKSSPSHIRVTNQEGDLVYNLTLGDLLNGKDLRFWLFPFEKVLSFTFLIRAPQGDFPGELIRLWKMITYLLQALHKRVLSWPKVIVVDVQETAATSWKTGSTLNESVTDLLAGRSHATPYNDLEIALLPFITLRPPTSHALRFEVPQCIRTSRIDKWISFPSADKCGCDSSSSANDPATTTQCEHHPLYYPYHPLISLWNLWFEEELDLTQDASAASLRLERCANWSKIAEKEHACWLWGPPPRTTYSKYPFQYDDVKSANELLFGIDDDVRLTQLLWARYENMRRFNPARKTYNLLIPWDGKKEAKEENDTTTLPLTCRGDGWDARLWWETYGDEGLPPLSFGHRFARDVGFFNDRFGITFDFYAMIDHEGIRLHDKRNELNVGRGGWLS